MYHYSSSRREVTVQIKIFVTSESLLCPLIVASFWTRTCAATVSATELHTYTMETFMQENMWHEFGQQLPFEGCGKRHLTVLSFWKKQHHEL